MSSFRTTLFWLHLVCGVVTGLVIFIMSATGVALTYEKQMLRWADGFDAQAACAGAEPLRVDALVARVGAEKGKPPTAVLFRADPSQPVRVSFGRESVEVNPCTGSPMESGSTGLRDFMRAMIVWHRWLGQEGDGRAVGKAITGVSNLAFLFIIVSGVYLWWPKEWTWKHLKPIVLFRGGLRGKARDFNWHNVFGLWCAVPLFLVAGTAVFFSYSWSTDLLYAVTGEERPAGRGGPAAPGRAPGQPEPTAGLASLDSLWLRATRTTPDWRSVTMRFPGDPAGPLSFTIDRGNGFRPDLRSTLLLNRVTGEVIRESTYSDNSTAQNARSWIRWIHTGEAGGLAGQTVAGVVSVAACFLVYTGWMLSWRRFRAWRQRS